MSDKQPPKPATPQTELAYVGTDALIEELQKRHAVLVVAGIRLNDPNHYGVRMTGGLIQINGVADAIAMTARNAMRNSITP